MEKYKTFLDTVHGYITVPKSFCDAFIDTPNFQRLRRIEQLSSRSLFPCARHDRFVHSLGVYHIGKKLVKVVKKKGLDVSSSLENTFLIACLLHDVGHSPFSHTLEGYFGFIDKLFAIYKGCLKEKEQDSLDTLEVEGTDVKQHEIISALLCITTYYEEIKELGASPSLVGRMIMGFKYETQEKSLEDCFISLLHGDVIDADKLDYVCRDSWASGYQSNSVDVERIIRAIIIEKFEEKWQISYSKSALYEIRSLVENKNFQSNWIFKHHQVIYEQKIFKDCIKELVECLQPGMEVSKLFNYEAFYREVEVCSGTSIYMLSDDDIIYLLKTHINEKPCFQEWMSHQYRYVPIWKTYSEMIAVLGKEISDKIMMDTGEIYQDIVDFLRSRFKIDAFSLDATPSIKSVDKGQVQIKYVNGVVDFADLGILDRQDIYKDRTFQYIFVERKLLEEGQTKASEMVINAIKSYVQSRKLSNQLSMQDGN